jgi:hypothetical protein
LNVHEFVNADAIAQGLSAFEPDRVAIAAGRIMLFESSNSPRSERILHLKRHWRADPSYHGLSSCLSPDMRSTCYFYGCPALRQPSLGWPIVFDRVGMAFQKGPCDDGIGPA